MKSIAQQLSLKVLKTLTPNQPKDPNSLKVYTYAIVGSQIVDIEVMSKLTSEHNEMSVVGISRDVALKLTKQLKTHFKTLGIALPRSGLEIEISPATNLIECRNVSLAVFISILFEIKILPEMRENQICTFGELSHSGTIHPVVGILPYLLNRLETPILAITSEQCAPEAELLENASVESSNDLMSLIYSILGKQYKHLTKCTAEMSYQSRGGIDLKFEYRGLSVQNHLQLLRSQPNEFRYWASVLSYSE